MPQVRIEIIPAAVLLGHDACVLVYQDGRLVSRVKATVDYQIGADGGRYPCAKLDEEDAVDDKK